jgi:hypothetical protein
MCRHRRPILIIMALMMVWLSLWTSTCLAMGAGQSSMPGMTCDCPFAGQSGDMAAGCARADNLSSYVNAKPAHANVPVFYAIPTAPVGLLQAFSHAATALPAIDQSPPQISRRLNVQYCVFLI